MLRSRVQTCRKCSPRLLSRRLGLCLYAVGDAGRVELRGRCDALPPVLFGQAREGGDLRTGGPQVTKQG